MSLVNLSDVVEINPRTTLKKGEYVKSAPMSSLESFTRSVTGFQIQEFKGGVKFKQGDTLMARITPSLENGKTALVNFLNPNEVGFGSTEFIVLRSIPGVTDAKYVYYLAISPSLRETAIKSMTGTSGRQRVQTDVVKNYSFLLPPLEEQKAISEVLSSLDDKIELLQKQNETLEALAQTLFRQWFIEEADDSWEEVELHELVDLQGGYAFKSSSYVDNGDYTVITIKSVQDGYLDTQSANHIDVLPEKLKPHQLLEHGDVLLSLTGNVGRVCFVDKGNCVLNQRVAKIKAKDELYRSWSYVFFRQPHMISQLTALSKGTAQLNLSPVETGKIIVSTPDNRVLEKFNTIVNPMLEKILLNKHSIHRITETRDTLLPKLMSGQVRVKLD